MKVDACYGKFLDLNIFALSIFVVRCRYRHRVWLADF